ncbi:MAG: hypothetical protein DHS20C08_08290 [Rhodomicrobium sp.]|nr:MAG: hypothetical protein DHS20C08_08290 [Rhodomicrobium sp.]
MADYRDRYIIALAPSKLSLLWTLAAKWLAYDAASKRSVKEPETLGLPQNIHNPTVSPIRRSGFGILLSGPFQLHRALSVEDLINYVDAFAEQQEPMNSGKLNIRAIENRLYMEPLRNSPKIRNLADECVRYFHKFRMPSKELPANSPIRKALTAPQLEHYLKWGQPYVFDEFKQQIPLTARLPDQVVKAMQVRLSNHFGNSLNGGLKVDNLTLFRQPDNLQPAEMIHQADFMLDTNNEPITLPVIKTG